MKLHQLMKRKQAFTILIADDDEEDRMMAEEALEESQFNSKMRFAMDGEEVMDYLNNRGRFSNKKENPIPELILLDLNMPKKDGWEVIAEIKKDKRLRSIPIVVLTTSNADADIRETYNLGVNSYITKPVTFAGFVEAMKSMKRYWFEVATLPVLNNREN